MTLAEFESYGVSVSLILRTQRTYVVLVGISSAVADAMPPANADGTPNQTAQDNAIMATISAANRYGFTSPPAGTTLLDLEHFSMDVADTMNNNNGALELLTPGISLRIVDSYIITATSNGQVNWSEVDANLSTVVSKYISSGLIKIPPGMFSYGVTSFVNSLAKIIYDYKVATHRTTLRAN
jgi:hypothetical protein